MSRSASIASALLLASCGSRADSPEDGAAGANRPEVVVEFWVSWTVAGATIALMLLPVGFVLSFVLDKYVPGAGRVVRVYAIPLALALIGTIVLGEVVHWIAEHLFWFALIGVVASVLGALWWAKRNARKIEPTVGVDLDRDGSIGAAESPDEDERRQGSREAKEET